MDSLFNLTEMTLNDIQKVMGEVQKAQKAFGKLYDNELLAKQLFSGILAQLNIQCLQAEANKKYEGLSPEAIEAQKVAEKAQEIELLQAQMLERLQMEVPSLPDDSVEPADTPPLADEPEA